MKAALLLLALAGAPELLLPPWPLSPDGELVAVRGGAPLTAERAAVETLAPGLFLVTPAPGARRVALSAADATAEVSVEPPPGVIEIVARPSAPVKGRDAQVELELAVSAPEGALAPEAPPEIVASSGRVLEVLATAPGRFHARYEPAATRQPEVVVLLALSPRCPLCPTPRAVGFVVLPLAAAIELPGRSEPGARTTVGVGGRTFGPVVADSRGRFSVPVVVPPGVHHASAVSVDRIGNRKQTEIDLGLPEVDRLACAAWPRVLPADGRAEAAVWCVVASDLPPSPPDPLTHGAGPGTEGEGGLSGSAATLSPPLDLTASAGSITPATPFRGALQRATFRAPRGGGGSAATITVRHMHGRVASAETIAVGLATGAPAGVTVELAEDPVRLGATIPAEALVRDARGDLVGRAAAPPGSTEGFVEPGRFVARAAAGDLVQRAPLAFALAPGKDAATLSLRRDGSAWVAVARTVDARPAAGVPLRLGSGEEVVTDARGEARAAARGARETVVAPSGARAAGWEGVVPPAASFELTRTVDVALRPRTAVDVSARVEGGFLRWRVEDDSGRPLPGRPVSLRGRGVDLGPAERDGDGGRAAIRSGHGPVAVVDEATGVAAIVEVP